MKGNKEEANRILAQITLLRDSLELLVPDCTIISAPLLRAISELDGCVLGHFVTFASFNPLMCILIGLDN